MEIGSLFLTRREPDLPRELEPREPCRSRTHRRKEGGDPENQPGKFAASSLFFLRCTPTTLED